MAIKLATIVQEILERTNDGADLAPPDHLLVVFARKKRLGPGGIAMLKELLTNVRKGYNPPWFHGIEHLTYTMTDKVCWRGQPVWQIYPPLAYLEETKPFLVEIARRCHVLELSGEPITYKSVVAEWADIDLPVLN